MRRQYGFWAPSLRPDELMHYGRQGMKWYQHIFGPVQAGAKYAKGKLDQRKADKRSKEKASDKNSEEYYRNRAKNGHKLTSEEIGYYGLHVYKVPDYSNLNKKEKAEKEAKYLNDRSKRIDDLNYAGRDPILGLQGHAMMSKINNMASVFYDLDDANNKKIADGIRKMYKYSDDEFAAFKKSGYDSKTGKFKNEAMGRRYKELRNKYWQQVEDISGMYLKELGFEDTPETRQAIRDYWYDY